MVWKMARPLADRLLHLLHNLAAVNPDNAKPVSELAKLAQEPVDQVQFHLRAEEAAGNVRSVSDDKNEQRYYLTGLGILKAVSMLT